jgi:hypothetical protein
MKPDTPPMKCAVCGAPLHVVVARTSRHLFVDGDIKESLKYDTIPHPETVVTSVQCSEDASHSQPYEGMRKLIHDALKHSMPNHVTMGPDENGAGGFNFTWAGVDDEDDHYVMFYSNAEVTYAVTVYVEVQQVC